MWRKNLLAASKAAFPAAKEECAAQLDLARKNHAAKCANIVRTLPIWSPGSPSNFCVSQRKELATPVTNQFIVEYRVMRQENDGLLEQLKDITAEVVDARALLQDSQRRVEDLQHKNKVTMSELYCDRQSWRICICMSLYQQCLLILLRQLLHILNCAHLHVTISTMSAYLVATMSAACMWRVRACVCACACGLVICGGAVSIMLAYVMPLYGREHHDP